MRGGNAINKNFKGLSTHIATSDPTTSNDNTQGYVVGSRWYNSSTTTEWICLSNASGAADWHAFTSGALGNYLPLVVGAVDERLPSRRYLCLRVEEAPS